MMHRDPQGRKRKKEHRPLKKIDKALDKVGKLKGLFGR
jgi:hypothetical protein